MAVDKLSVRVLVTGNLGYVGTVLTEHLQRAGHLVRGLDWGYFTDCAVAPPAEPDEQIIGDIRDFELTALVGLDFAVHLAEISDETNGTLDPRVLHDINVGGTQRVAEATKNAGIPLIVLSCSSFDPRYTGSGYQASKLAAEETVRRLSDARYQPRTLRFGIPYGYSPRLRVDLTLNALAARRAHSDDTSTEPPYAPDLEHVHVEDMAATIASALDPRFRHCSPAAATITLDERIWDLTARLRETTRPDISDDGAFARAGFLRELIAGGVLDEQLRRRPSLVGNGLGPRELNARRMYPLW